MSTIKTPSIVKFKNYLDDNYNFRYNIISNTIEHKKINNENFLRLEDRSFNSILIEMQSQNLCINQGMLTQLLNSDSTPIYNPLLDYFNNLPQYDGHDYIEELSGLIKTSDNDYWKWCFKKWIVALVASIIDDKIINHAVLIFQGGQGIGKTTWLENLIPESMKNYLYTGTINPNNKDTLVKLAECLLINLDELENLTRKSVGSLKQLITQSQISIRRPYSKSHDTMPRRASFAGSVNNSQFLNDGTGSRRWLCHEVLEIDLAKSIPLDKVYSQVIHLIDNGFKHWFDSSDIPRIHLMNEKFEIRTPSEELLLRYFRKPNKKVQTKTSTNFIDLHAIELDQIKYLTASDILERLNNKSNLQISYLNTVTLGKALAKHGFKRVSKQNRYTWKVIELDIDTIEKQEKNDK